VDLPEQLVCQARLVTLVLLALKELPDLMVNRDSPVMPDYQEIQARLDFL